MRAYMTTEEALVIQRSPISIGSWYTFYSDCVECKTENGELIRNYSGQPVKVLRNTNDDPTGGEFFTVQAANGDKFTANEGELNGWIFDTGQWVGPRVN